MIRWIKEAWQVMVQSLRMLLAGKQTVLLLAAGLILLVTMLVNMEEAKEEKSKIVIGIADNNQSELSWSVMEGMKQKDLYEVIVGEEEELIELLKNNELSAVCVFKKNFANTVANGRTKNLVTIYETEDSNALLLGDIMAGVMMQEICTAKGYQMLLKYEKKTGRETSLSAEEYRDYVLAVLAEGGTEFRFDVSYLSREKEVEKPSQSILYEQAIYAVFALMAGLISVYAVLPFRKMRHGKLAERMKTLPVHGSALYVGSALAGVWIPLGFGVLFLLCLFVRNPMEISEFLSLLVCTTVYICVIVCMMLLAAYGIKNHTVYQMGMLAMILVFGVFGLVSLVDGLLIPEGAATWIPNGWYVRRMTELYHQ